MYQSTCNVSDLLLLFPNADLTDNIQTYKIYCIHLSISTATMAVMKVMMTYTD